MTNPILFRRRIIPEECIQLKDDIIVSCDEERIVTKWNSLHPKPKLHHGASVYFLKEGFKVSKFCSEDDTLMYWYCDIVNYVYDKDENRLEVIDLLADVVVYPDGFVKVLDLDELTDALEAGKINLETLKDSLRKLDKLLNIIYRGQFDELKKYLP